MVAWPAQGLVRVPEARSRPDNAGRNVPGSSGEEPGREIPAHPGRLDSEPLRGIDSLRCSPRRQVGTLAGNEHVRGGGASQDAPLSVGNGTFRAEQALPSVHDGGLRT